MVYKVTLLQRVADAIGVRISWLGEFLRLDNLIYNPLTFRNFHRAAAYSAPAVVRTFKSIYPNAKTFLDVGSGSGAYAAQLARVGLKVVALERSASGRRMAIKEGVDCRYFDLSKIPPCVVDGRFDVAYCFEVAEHLPEKLAGSLIDFITNMTSNVVFTAAAPGQIGIGHINCQPKEYWINLFSESGFVYCDDITREMTRSFQKHEVIYWLTHNVMIFRQEDETI